MKLAIITTLLATATAFSPSFIATSKASTSLNMDRREMLTSAALAVPATLVLPNIALADGSVSAATKNRARGIYGNRIASLGSAVASGKKRQENQTPYSPEPECSSLNLSPNHSQSLSLNPTLGLSMSLTI